MSADNSLMYNDLLHVTVSHQYRTQYHHDGLIGRCGGNQLNAARFEACYAPLHPNGSY